MDNQLNHSSANPYSGISDMPEMAKYIGLMSEMMGQSFNLAGHIVNHQMVIAQEETNRLAIREKSAIEMTEISRQLDMLDKELLADIDKLKAFVERTMDAVHKLIDKEQYELADRFHDRVAANLEGRVSKVADKFNQRNQGRNIHFLEE